MSRDRRLPAMPVNVVSRIPLLISVVVFLLFIALYRPRRKSSKTNPFSLFKYVEKKNLLHFHRLSLDR